MATDTSTRHSPLSLLVGLVAFVALLSWWVGWALPVVIVLVALIVMIHETGHFLTAKRSGMLVSDFFVGFGPILWSRRRGETRYGVRALLLGGYVKVPGMVWGTDETVPEARTYRSATYPRKVLFASAGSITHGLMALVLAWASLSFVGLASSSHVGVLSFEHWRGHHENAAQLAGLRLGDQIVSIDGRAITSSSTLVSIVHGASGERLTLVVARDGHDVTLHATPVDGRTIVSGGAALAEGSRAKGYLGFEVGSLVVHDSLLGAVPDAFGQVGSAITGSLRALVHVFSPGDFTSLAHQVTSSAAATKPSNQDSRPMSIVGVVRVATQGAQAGPGDLLYILMILNIFIGIMNMLPLLPLDGGYVAIATYERLRSRKGVRYHADVNKLAPVVYAFMSVLVVLFLSTLYLDIAHPIANPFG